MEAAKQLLHDDCPRRDSDHRPEHADAAVEMHDQARRGEEIARAMIVVEIVLIHRDHRELVRDPALEHVLAVVTPSWSPAARPTCRRTNRTSPPSN